MDIKIGIIGLGYVGLPIALAFAKKFPGTVGFDINQKKIEELKAAIDRTGEISAAELKQASLEYSSDGAKLKGVNFFVVAVPTPIDVNHNPDLEPLRSASEIVGKVLSPGAIVVYESTVYPGVTEDFCGPILAKISGLKQGVDFKLGYSPERINPGDKTHSLERVIKVVSGEDAATLNKVAEVYGTVIPAGVFRAHSIKVAEAAKVIENTQRDLNIALMNELAIIFDLMKIPTREVLRAAGTKWNFLSFTPGLVGGHCIGVDPYYLTTKAEQLGYHPQVILAGRRINDGMGSFIAQRTVKLMVNAGLQIKGARIGILGLTFKENVSDLRNSRVPDIVNELKQFGVVPLVTDPLVESAESEHEYGIKLHEFNDMHDLDGVILAVAHTHYIKNLDTIIAAVKPKSVFVDVKAVIDSSKLPSDLIFWSL